MYVHAKNYFVSFTENWTYLFSIKTHGFPWFQSKCNTTYSWFKHIACTLGLSFSYKSLKQVSFEYHPHIPERTLMQRLYHGPGHKLNCFGGFPYIIARLFDAMRCIGNKWVPWVLMRLIGSALLLFGRVLGGCTCALDIIWKLTCSITVCIRYGITFIHGYEQICMIPECSFFYLL